MSNCSSPTPSASYTESADGDELSSSCSPPLEIADTFPLPEAMPKSAFRAIGAAGPLSMHQRLLAMLQNELPQPLRCVAAEPCSTTGLENTMNAERKVGEKEADYLERRRKNNDSARRSREVRRRREETNRRQVEVLENENTQLRAQIALLRVEVSQLSLVLLAKGVTPLS
ncbi:unnamed protein product [Nippostrongylus brasiliensis]|uniref:BZIP domain-containing protein n=1 Tax=Nippostrongylus brasiliensis TaxID=27835 RepID=A0A0N4YDC8_NIPBR|nr:hypothetical protein Q1695_008788 [Nippostrongylus brasiliensis]VDL78205.1 unnamed protein product [Nippostrongylus brasiliensis]